MRVWHRSLAIIQKSCPSHTSPRMSAKRSSPVYRLPLEIVEMIIAHLIYDRFSLLACSMTCRSWYITAVPHIHHTFTAILCSCAIGRRHQWPMSLLYMRNLGLLPLVKRFHICGNFPLDHPEGFSPNWLTTSLLPQFLALTNVRELEIERLNIPDFIPSIQQYFKNILPTLQSLTLRIPHGSPRQILYFVGQFQHLEDFTFFFRYEKSFLEETAKDLTLIPPFTPPL